MIVHYWFFEDVSAVIEACPLCIMLCTTCRSFEVDHLLSGQSVLWDQRAMAYPLSLNQKKIAAMYWSQP